MVNSTRRRALERIEAIVELAESQDDARIANSSAFEFRDVSDAELEALVIEGRKVLAQAFLERGNPCEWPEFGSEPRINRELWVALFDEWSRGLWEASTALDQPSETPGGDG